MSFEIANDYEFEIGDEFDLPPAYGSKVISAVMAQGGEVELDGNIVRVIALPGKAAKPAPAPAPAPEEAKKEEVVEAVVEAIDDIVEVVEEVAEAHKGEILATEEAEAPKPRRGRPAKTPVVDEAPTSEEG